jgi:hypothetical protein
MKKTLYIIMLLCTLIVLGGCATPTDDGGSALPWSRPEPWENKMPGAPSMSY